MKSKSTTISTIWAATVIILVLAVVGAVWPKPSASANIKKLNDKKDQITSQIEATNQLLDSSQKMIDAHDWKKPIGLIGPEALTDTSNLATAHSIKLTSFHPSKPQLIGNLTMVPFTATVQGSFPSINSFIDALYKNPRIAVLGYQITLSGQSGNTCQANISLAGFTSQAGNNS